MLEQFRQFLDGPAGGRSEALVYQLLHVFLRYDLPKCVMPDCLVGDGIRQVFNFNPARSLPPHLFKIEAGDVLELIDDEDQRCRDNAARQPCRNNSGGENENCQPNEQLPYRPLDRTKKLSFRNDGRERPTGKGERRQSNRIGIAGSDQPYPARSLPVAVVRAAGLFYRALSDREQRLIVPLQVDLSGIW